MNQPEMEKSVAVSDLYKIHDALHGAVEFHKHRDIMNAAVHKATDIRYSPLTSTLMAELDRLRPTHDPS